MPRTVRNRTATADLRQAQIFNTDQGSQFTNFAFFETGSEARIGIGCWIAYYNADRPTRSSAAGRPTRFMLRRQIRRNWRRNQTQNQR